MGTTFAPSGTVRTRAATRGGRVASVRARAAQNRACRVPTLAAARRYPRTGAGITDLARLHAVSPAHQRVGVPPARSSRGKINRGTTVISRDAVSEATVLEEPARVRAEEALAVQAHLVGENMAGQPTRRERHVGQHFAESRDHK